MELVIQFPVFAPSFSLCAKANKFCKWNQLGAQFILSVFRQFYL